MVEMYLDAREGKWNAASLFDSHVEHRWAITRLLTLLLNLISSVDLRVQNYASVVFAVCALVMLFLLARRTIQDRTVFVLAMVPVALLLLSPTQWQNWLWAVNMSYFLVCLALAFSIWAFSCGWRQWPTFWALVGAALVSTFTFSTGLAAWPALFLCIVALSLRRKTVVPVVAWVLVAAVVFVFYFFVEAENKAGNSHTPMSDGQPGLYHTKILLMNQPAEFVERLLHFFLMLLGNPLCRGLLIRSQELAPLLGGFLIVMIATSFWLIGGYPEKRARADLLYRLIPWIALIAFGMLSAVFISIGRVGMYPATGAISGRYVTFPSLAWIGMIVVFFAALHARYPDLLKDARGALIVGGVSGVLFMLLFCNWYYGSRQMALWSWGRYHGLAGLRFIDVLPSLNLSIIEGDQQLIKRVAKRLEEHGLMRFPLLKNRRLDNFKISKRVTRPRRGSMELLPPAEDGRPRVKGVALMEGADRPADAILFVTRDGEERLVFDLCRADALNPHIRAVAGRDAEHMLIRRILSEEFGEFQTTLDTSLLEPGEHEVEAWIYSVAKNTVYRIPGSVKIQVPEATQSLEKLAADS